VKSNDVLLELLLEKRERLSTRSNLDKWAEQNGFVPALHHRLLNAKLMEAASQPDKRIMVCMPPGSAKSTYSSVLFPPFFLAQSPNKSILAASHNKDLIVSFGRRARNSIESHPTVLGFSLKADTKAADEWETTNGGRYFCAGVGAKIAGHRADLGLIDDPIGSKEEAESKLIRDKVWDWWEWDFKPRLKPGASVVIINTRWHDDDLCGRLEIKEPGRWEKIVLPLIAEDNDPLGRKPGESLWPEWFTPTLVEDARNSEAFIPLYQQKPTPESGDYFKQEWFRYYQTPQQLPSDLRYYAGSDHALSKREEADKTCMIVVGADSNDNIWLLPDGVWWKRETSDVVVDQMLHFCHRFRINFWWAGKDHITGSIGPFLRQREMKEHVFVPLEETTSSRSDNNKAARAQSIRGFMKRGQVFIPSFADWWPDAKNELLRFDKGTHDDFVDALAEIGMGIDRVIGHRSSPVTPVTLDPPRITLRYIKESTARMERRERELLIDR